MHKNKLASYVVTHDYGFAPNPYGGVLTLATCKPAIRKHAHVGDWIMGTGSKEGIGASRLVFLAQVSKVMKLDEYGSSGEYAFKAPRQSTDDWTRRGDNIYYKNNEGAWRQRKNPFHGLQDIDHDIEGENALVCETYWYFGDLAPEIPPKYKDLVKSGPGHKNNIGNSLVPDFLKWVAAFETGVHGNPSSNNA